MLLSDVVKCLCLIMADEQDSHLEMINEFDIAAILEICLQSSNMQTLFNVTKLIGQLFQYSDN